MKSIVSIGISTCAAVLAVAAENVPQKFYYCGKTFSGTYNLTAADVCAVTNAAGEYTKTTWQDGNWLYLLWEGVAEWPPSVNGDVSADDNSYLTVDKDASLYGLYYRSGQRWMQGAGKLTLGEGGYQAPNSWDVHQIQIAGGIHLAKTQTWLHKGGVRILQNCKMTAEAGITWTVSGSLTGFFVDGENDLSGADIVLTSASQLHFTSENSSFNAKSITLDGTIPRLIVDASRRPAVIDRAYAKKLILKNGAGLDASSWYTNVVFDLDGVEVASGSSSIGTGNVYAIADGGELPLAVSGGATCVFGGNPTSGTFRVTGAGTFTSDIGTWPAVTFSDFSGVAQIKGCSKVLPSLPGFDAGSSLTLVNAIVSVADLTGFAGTITVSGTTQLALPDPAVWPEGVTVTTADSATLILPVGTAPGDGQLLGTKSYQATARGISAEPAGIVTVGAGETLIVAGNGFGADTSIVLNGGTLSFPYVSASVSAPVSVTGASTVSVASGVSASLSGVVSVQANVTVSGGGTLVFSGGGTVASGATVLGSAGEFEFRGGEWAFASGSLLQGHVAMTRIAFTQGVNAVFETGTDAERSGLKTGIGGAGLITVEISGGSTVTFNDYRTLRLGDMSWRNKSALVVDGATLAVKGRNGGFDLSCNALKNTTDDRCAVVYITVKNGGVIETDRVLSTPPITHMQLPEEGLHITLDGGTYRLGSAFGAQEGDLYPRQHPNQLFGGATWMNEGVTVPLDYTAEVEVTIGENGGVFDLSLSQAANVTNTVAGRPVDGANTAYFPDGIYPTLGPRWTVNGPLTVKGNGAQSFVINGLNAAALGTIAADGAVVTVISDNPASVPVLSLGERGGWRVESADGTARNLSVETVSVAAGGTYDAGAFHAGNTAFGNMTFGYDSVLAVTRVDGEALLIPVSGTVTLAEKMRYRSPGAAKALSAEGGILPLMGKGVSWLPDTGCSELTVRVTENAVNFIAKGLLISIY